MIDLKEFSTDIDNIGCREQMDAAMDIISDAITKKFPNSCLTPIGKELIEQYVFDLGVTESLNALKASMDNCNELDSVVLHFITTCFAWVKYGKPIYDATNGGGL